MVFSTFLLVSIGADRPTTTPFAREPDVIYGRKCGLALTLDVFRPAENRNGVGIIYIVSSGWGSSHSAINMGYVNAFLGADTPSLPLCIAQCLSSSSLRSFPT